MLLNSNLLSIYNRSHPMTWYRWSAMRQVSDPTSTHEQQWQGKMCFQVQEQTVEHNMDLCWTFETNTWSQLCWRKWNLLTCYDLIVGRCEGQNGTQGIKADLRGSRWNLYRGSGNERWTVCFIWGSLKFLTLTPWIGPEPAYIKARLRDHFHIKVRVQRSSVVFW